MPEGLPGGVFGLPAHAGNIADATGGLPGGGLVASGRIENPAEASDGLKPGVYGITGVFDRRIARLRTGCANRSHWANGMGASGTDNADDEEKHR